MKKYELNAENIIYDKAVSQEKKEIAEILNLTGEEL